MPATHFKPSYSKQWAAMLIGLMGLNLGIVISLPIHIGFKLIFIFILMTYSVFIFKNYRRLIPFQYQGDGMWQLHDRLHTYNAELSGDSTITRWVSILRFRVLPSGKMKSCVVFRDALGFELYRRLLVIVRMG